MSLLNFELNLFLFFSGISPLDFSSATCEIKQLKSELEEQKETIKDLKQKVEMKDKRIQQLKDQLDNTSSFGTKTVLKRRMKIKNLFKYNTSITYARFLAVLAYLVPGKSR